MRSLSIVIAYGFILGSISLLYVKIPNTHFSILQTVLIFEIIKIFGSVGISNVLEMRDFYRKFHLSVERYFLQNYTIDIFIRFCTMLIVVISSQFIYKFCSIGEGLLLSIIYALVGYMDIFYIRFMNIYKKIFGKFSSVYILIFSLGMLALNLFVKINLIPLMMVLIGGLSILMMWALRYIKTIKDFSFIFEESLKVEIEVKEIVDERKRSEINIDDTDKLKTGNYKYNGFRLLNKLFFQRNRKIFFKPALKKLIVACILVIIFKIAQTIYKPDLKEGIENIFSIIMVFLYFMQSEKLFNAMYYNCDESFLGYSFYKKKINILKLYFYRLEYIFLFYMIFFIPILGLYIMLYDLGVLTLFEICIHLLAEILYLIALVSYQLFLYYILLPYNKDGKVSTLLPLLLKILLYALILLGFKFVKNAYILMIVSIIFTTIFILLVVVFAKKRFKLRY